MTDCLYSFILTELNRFRMPKKSIHVLMYAIIKPKTKHVAESLKNLDKHSIYTNVIVINHSVNKKCLLHYFTYSYVFIKNQKGTVAFY